MCCVLYPYPFLTSTNDGALVNLTRWPQRCSKLCALERSQEHLSSGKTHSLGQVWGERGREEGWGERRGPSEGGPRERLLARRRGTYMGSFFSFTKDSQDVFIRLPLQPWRHRQKRLLWEELCSWADQIGRGTDFSQCVLPFPLTSVLCATSIFSKNNFIWSD